MLEPHRLVKSVMNKDGASEKEKYADRNGNAGKDCSDSNYIEKIVPISGPSERGEVEYDGFVNDALQNRRPIPSDQEQWVDDASFDSMHDGLVACADGLANIQAEQHPPQKTQCELSLNVERKGEQKVSSQAFGSCVRDNEEVLEQDPASFVVYRGSEAEFSKDPHALNTGMAQQRHPTMQCLPNDGSSYQQSAIKSFREACPGVLVENEIPSKRLKKKKKVPRPSSVQESAAGKETVVRCSPNATQEAKERAGHPSKHVPDQSKWKSGNAYNGEFTCLNIAGQNLSPSSACTTRLMHESMPSHSDLPVSDFEQVGQHILDLLLRKQQECELVRGAAHRDLDTERKSHAVECQKLQDQLESLLLEKDELAALCSKQKDELLNAKVKITRFRTFVDGLGNDMQNLKRAADTNRSHSERIINEGRQNQSAQNCLVERVIADNEKAMKLRDEALRASQDMKSALSEASTCLKYLGQQLSEKSKLASEEKVLRLQVQEQLVYRDELNASFARHTSSIEVIMDKLYEMCTRLGNLDNCSEMKDALKKTITEVQGWCSRHGDTVEELLSIKCILEAQDREVKFALREGQDSLITIKGALTVKVKELQSKTEENAILQARVITLQRAADEASTATAKARTEVATAAKIHLEEERSQWANEKLATQTELINQIQASKDFHAQMQQCWEKESQKYQAEREENNASRKALEERLTDALQQLHQLRQPSKSPMSSIPGPHNDNFQGSVIQGEQAVAPNGRPTPAPNSSSRLVRSSSPEMGRTRITPCNSSGTLAPTKRKAAEQRRTTRKRAKQDEMSGAFDKELSRP